MKPIRTLITPVVIAALAVTGVTATQARADSSSDLAKILFGVAAVAVVASAIDNDRRKSTTYSASRNARNGRIVTVPERRDRWRTRYALPSNCLRTYDSRRGERKLFSGRCLNRAGYKIAKMPKACEYTIVGRKGRGKAYGPRCLARAGYYTIDPKRRHQPRPQHIVWDD